MRALRVASAIAFVATILLPTAASAAPHRILAAICQFLDLRRCRDVPPDAPTTQPDAQWQFLQYEGLPENPSRGYIQVEFSFLDNEGDLAELRCVAATATCPSARATSAPSGVVQPVCWTLW